MRTTKKHLENKIEYLNKITGNENEAYTRTEEGLRSNVGCYFLSQAYGKCELQQMANKEGGVTSVFGGGHRFTKSELADMISAYIKGIETDKK